MKFRFIVYGLGAAAALLSIVIGSATRSGPDARGRRNVCRVYARNAAAMVEEYYRTNGIYPSLTENIGPRSNVFTCPMTHETYRLLPTKTGFYLFDNSEHHGGFSLVHRFGEKWQVDTVQRDQIEVLTKRLGPPQ